MIISDSMSVTSFFSGVATFILSLMLMSCQSASYLKFTQYHTCHKTCQSRLKSCHDQFRHDCLRCKQIAHQQMTTRYQHYVQEQSIKGEIIVRRLNSYLDPLQCRKITCNCAADYQVCTQSCGGQNHQQLHVPPVCR